MLGVLQRIVFIILLSAIPTFTSAVKAQEPARAHNLYLNFFDYLNVASVNYDTRFPGSSVFGWHAGIGYCAIIDLGGITLPMGVNAILGHRASKFEIGVSAVPTLTKWQASERILNEHGNYKEYYGPKKVKARLGWGFNIGYRLQRKSGFFFRSGFAPMFCSLGDDNNGLGIALLELMPYFGFGYTLK